MHHEYGRLTHGNKLRRLKKIEHRATKRVALVHRLPYEERLKALYTYPLSYNEG